MLFRPFVALLAILLFSSTTTQAGSVQAHMQKEPEEVLIFTLPDCAFCEKAKNLMTRKHIPFREIDLATPEGAIKAESMKLPPIAPVFSYKNRILQGFSESRFLLFLE